MLIWLLVLAAAAPVHDPRCDSVKTDDLLACADAQYRRADAELNAAWKSIRGRDHIVAAQRTWLAWRTKECEAENYASPDGHEYEIVRLSCLADLTEQRAKQLRENYKWLAD